MNDMDPLVALLTIILCLAFVGMTLWVFDWDWRCVVVHCVVVKP